MSSNSTPAGSAEPLKKSERTDNIDVEEEVASDQGRTDHVDNKEEKEEKKEEIPAKGGISRVAKEYGNGVAIYGWLGAIGGILNGATLPAFFILFGDLIDVGSNTMDVDLKGMALELMWKFIICGVGFFLFNIFQYISFGYYGAKISCAVRKAYFELLLQQEVGYYDEKNSGALNTAMISDCLNIAGMGTAMGLMCQHMVTFVAGFVLSFYYSWRLSLVLLAVSPLFVVVGIISAQFEKKGAAGGLRGDDSNQKKDDPVAAAGSFSNEVLVSIRSVKAIPMLLEDKLREYKEKLEDIVPAAKRQGLGMGVSLGGMFFIFLGVMYSLGYWYGGKLVDEGEIEIGDMYLCMFALPIGAMSLGQLGTANADLTKARNAANKFFALKDRKPQIKAPDNEDKAINKNKERLQGNISFKNVSFAYPTATDTIVLDNVSFEVESGKTLALVGPSGSGKSTVVNLIERYYDPTKGEVRVDNELIHNYDIEYLRKNIGYVSQTPLLFAESIKENIRGGNPDISDEDVIEAAKTADAHDFIMELKDKYETNAGEMGNRLSGGQKQRIAIARAMVANPSILLFDEATSALDTKSEREVQRAIDKIAAAHSKTIVVIAHRLSTIKNADQILVIVDGEIEEKGNHEQLIEEDGVYAALVREQQVVTHENDDEEDAPDYEPEEAKEDDTGRTDNAAVTIDVEDGEKDKEEKKEEEEKEEAVPDMGGTKRLNREYASGFGCLFYSAVIFAFLNGLVWTLAYGWLFPEIITMLSDEIHCESHALSLDQCHTTFEEGSVELVKWWVIVGVYAAIVQCAQTYLFGIFGARLGNLVKYDWFAAMLNQDITYHDVKSSGTLNACLTAETQTISDGMGWKYGLVIQSISQILSGFGLAFYRSWRVSLVFLALTPLLIISGALGAWAWMGVGNANADPFLDSGTVSQEILTNIRTVLAFPYLLVVKNGIFVQKVEVGLPIATKRAAVSGFTMGLNLFISQGLIYGVGMYAGLLFVEKGWCTFDDVLGAFFGVLMGGMGLGQMGTAFPAYKAANIASNKFFVAMEREPERKKPDKAVSTKTRIAGSIEFRNVSFAYHSAPDTQVLKDVSFHVKAGETFAIVGPSGSGKSTIISLIERFYDTNAGDIVVDDAQAIHNYDLSHLRSSIGLVSQMPLLFDASIEENIRAGNQNATQDDIVEAATQANAHQFIEKFKAKYETNVGELGGKLSGGQRQRIAIARALLNKPSILLLDEATSALDSKSEKEVQQAIDHITQSETKRTVISIAHRLSTIKNANQIIVLVDGQVRESGNHAELMASRGVYAALVDAQTLVEQKTEIHKRRSKIIDPDELPQQPIANAEDD